MFEKDRLFADFTLNSEAEFKLYSLVADILERDMLNLIWLFIYKQILPDS